MLAHLANRTLILPPFYLGFGELPWRDYETLVLSLMTAERIVANGGSTADSQLSRKISGKSNKRAVVSVELLVSTIKSRHNVIDASEFLQRTRHCNLTLLEIRENVKYEYRYVDKMQSAALAGLSVYGQYRNFNSKITDVYKERPTNRYLLADGTVAQFT